MVMRIIRRNVTMLGEIASFSLAKFIPRNNFSRSLNVDVLFFHILYQLVIIKQ